MTILEVACSYSGSSSTWFFVELKFAGIVYFWGEGKTGLPGDKPLGAKERTNNELNPNIASTLGLEPGPYWWELSVLITAPALLPSFKSVWSSLTRNTWIAESREARGRPIKYQGWLGERKMEFRFRCEFYWRHFLEASAVDVPSLHRFRWQDNCGILSIPLYMFVVAVASSLSLVDGVAFAVLSDFLSPTRVSCCRLSLRGS